MYFVYLLQSLKFSRLYIGFTPDDVNRRLAKHNSGLVLSTKTYKPWKLIYFEAYLNRKDALGRERYLKSGSGRKFLNKQLRNYFTDKVK
ncbi:TPA: excinuclease ABC subunit C [Candidatus Beckwithbacteria bacterium]|nr:MAG: putative endonuclease containing a URI-like protein [Candidatus Beckwithbacteria bacterium GW2011_GWC1_49_16]OGD48186.1 MAG: hypothetical protein A2877_02825 [Candidatus Beckwithbacteria bacterium RIFCSPHIGHO2_01_FULL_49_39]OGD50183.1 MAG: hypothetical protein A3K56_00580 [Candidatus Beckwithbacteria bacterium RIFCSPHIGHO2_12_FULL_49_13]OGD51285.1 MAG: hypothetical protein A3D86_03445 [Candidatus Beckwithbacteria bacterium RIFCSPHIGHO2_02_FULL_49_13]OGD57627.1 MAG: hypothetical protein 